MKIVKRRSITSRSMEGWMMRDMDGMHQRLYSTARWKATRKHQLSIEPLCRMCRDDGRFTPAKIVDHIEPHRGDSTKFFGGPFQSLCKLHHDSTKQRQEKRGHEIGGDVNGRPLSASHHWNR